MDFSEFYTESDTTDELNEAGALTDLHRTTFDLKRADSTRMDGPVASAGGKPSSNRKNIDDDDDKGDDDDNGDDDDKGGHKRLIQTGDKHGSWGYTIEKGHDKYNEYVAMINDPKFDDYSKKVKKRYKFMEGYLVGMRPIKNPSTGVAPKENRQIFVGKSIPDAYDSDKGHVAESNGTYDREWTVIAWRTPKSFVDGLRTFFYDDITQSGNNANNIVDNTKWHQAAPKEVGDASEYAAWDHNSGTKGTKPNQRDRDFSTKTIRDIQAMPTQINFSTFYNKNELITEFIDIDKGLDNLFKKTAGGIRTALISPKSKTITNPNALKEFFPPETSRRVSEGAYTAINMLAAASFVNWKETKEEFGVIAQQFIKTRNTYVKTPLEINLKFPKESNEEKVAEFKAGFDDMTAHFDLDERDFEIEQIKLFELTNGGMIATMQFVVFGNTDEEGEAEAPDPNAPTPAPNAQQPKQNNIKDDTKEKREFESIYFVGVDKKGDEFFQKNYGYPMAKFIEKHNRSTPATITAEVDEMKGKQDDIMKQFMGGKGKFFVYENIPEKEYKSYLNTFAAILYKNPAQGKVDIPAGKTDIDWDYVIGKDDAAKTALIGTKETLLDTMTRKKINNNMVVNFKLKKGKVSFVGQGNKGKIVTNTAGLKVIENSGVKKDKFKPLELKKKKK